MRQDRSSQVRQFCRDIADLGKALILSETGRGVLKCSLAYLLGSLATFVPALSGFLGRQDGKHIVATVTVYFHPARSLGSMFEASVFAFTAFLYAAFISVTSMSVSVFFTDKLNRMLLGHIIVLVVFCGGGLGFVGWVKQVKGDPLVNVACSLTSLAIITVLTKEGAVQAGNFSFSKISQVLKMIIMGVLATMAVSVVVFPISARAKLKKNMVDVTDSLSDMLALVTSSFLSGSEEELQQKPFIEAGERHKKTYATLGKYLKEARYEHYVMGNERQYHVEAKLVHCVQRITQSMGGLRSAASMQFGVIRQPTTLFGSQSVTESDFLQSMVSSPSAITPASSRILSRDLNGSILPSIDEAPDEDENSDVDGNTTPKRSSMLRTPPRIFALFIIHLGPSMRSLAYTLKEILDDLPYGPAPQYEIKVNPKFRSSLERAIELYMSARYEALKLVYDKKDMDRQQPIEVEADWEEVAASCGHFSFSLLEVAEQVKDYLIILDELQLEMEENPAGTRTWTWLKFWRAPMGDYRRSSELDPEMAALIDQADDLDLHVKLPTSKERNVSNSSTSNPEKSLTKRKVCRKMWNAFAFLRHDDTKYAIKVGIGAALFALPSFLPSSRPFYYHWRGEWGLLSYMLVCSMTIGASNTTGFSRFIGTCLGAVCAIAAWEIGNDNPVILGLLGWCMSVWTSYIIVGQGKGPMGRFIMLTYNLSALYAYSLTVKDDENDDDEGGRRPEIFAIAYHRVAAVLVGCIWGLIITRVVWPISARQKLKDGLSILWLRMGLIWKRDPLAMFLEEQSSNRYMNLREEFELRRYVSSLEKLRESAKSEFELKGPFSDKTYARILESTSRMLDAFHAMNVVILKDLAVSKGVVELLRATRKEREQLCKRISHLFSGEWRFTCLSHVHSIHRVGCLANAHTVLASSMKLQYPLNDALPNTEHTRDRLLARMFAYRQLEALANETNDEDFSLLYTYALVTGQLGQEIREVLSEVENLFGVLDEELLKLQ